MHSLSSNTKNYGKILIAYSVVIEVHQTRPELSVLYTSTATFLAIIYGLQFLMLCVEYYNKLTV